MSEVPLQLLVDSQRKAKTPASRECGSPFLGTMLRSSHGKKIENKTEPVPLCQACKTEDQGEDAI